MEYFESKKISDHVVRIKDASGVFEYLVIGDDKACLIDTGVGVGNIAEYVKRITDKEVFVILTHGHYDHVSGAGLFENVYMNFKDKDAYLEYTNLEYRHHQLEKIELLRDIPVEDYNLPIDFYKLKALTDQQVFDLGGVHLKAIEVPGHTPGMTCIFIEEDRIMHFGDACGVFSMLFDDYSSCVSDYLKSLQYLKTFNKEYNYIIRNHGTGDSPMELLDNVIDCCDCILSGNDDKIPVHFADLDLLLAKEVDAKMNRVDGKQGNIAYRIDKAK